MSGARRERAGVRGPVALVEDALELCAQDLPSWIGQASAGLAFSGLLAWGALYSQRAPLALEHAGLWGLALSAAYSALKCAQSAYALGLAERAARRPPAGVPWLRRWRDQTAWQPWSLILLPLSALSILGLPHASAFFHNLALLDDGTQSPAALARQAWALSIREPMQLQLAHQLLLGAGSLILVNLLALVFGAAALAHSLLGLGGHLLDADRSLNSTLLLLALGGTLAVLQPLSKAVHVLRAGEARSKSQGEDLAQRLRMMEEGDAA